MDGYFEQSSCKNDKKKKMVRIYSSFLYVVVAVALKAGVRMTLSEILGSLKRD